MATASLPQSFWWDAFLTAVYLINRLPTPSLQNTSPYFSLFHHSPDYTLLKVFGCSCFPYLRPYNNSKLQYRSSKCLFLGYSQNHKGYRCLHPSGRIYIARSVLFNESEFPYSELFSPTLNTLRSEPILPTPCVSVPYLPLTNSHPPSSLSLPDISPSTSFPNQPTSGQSPSSSQSHSSHHHTSSQHSIPSSSSPNLAPHTAPNTHSMTTRSKNGVFKPKVYMAVSSTPPSTLFTSHDSQVVHTATKFTEPVSISDALAHPLWYDAMAAEIEAINLKDTWDIVPPTDDINPIDCKWVYRVKLCADDTLDKLKARLVAKGFQQLAGLDFLETFSPVVKPVSVRLLFSLAATYKWDIQHIDINNAFLNGHLDKPVYMKQPPGFEDKSHPEWVCRLKKSLYGLRQAPRAWYDRLKNHLISYGFKHSSSDHSFFFMRISGKLLMVLVYVDDILITGDDPLLVQKFIQTLSSEFALKTLGSVSFFLGIEVAKTSGSYKLSQSKYIRDLLAKTGLLESKAQSSPYDTGIKLHKSDSPLFGDPTLYRSTIGALQYLTITRPDISYMVNKLSQFLHQPTELQWKACKRLLRYLKGSLQLSLRFSSSDYLSLVAFSDADWAGSVDDRKSTGGYFVFLGPNLLSWSSKKQSILSRSSTEAEYRSLADTAMELVWIK